MRKNALQMWELYLNFLNIQYQIPNLIILIWQKKCRLNETLKKDTKHKYIYISYKSQTVLLNWLNSIKGLMNDNCLQQYWQNRSSESVVIEVMESIGSLSSSVKHTLSNLGVSMGQNSSFDQHVNGFVCSSFYQLRHIAKLRSIVPRTAGDEPSWINITIQFRSLHLEPCIVRHLPT